MDNVNFNSHEQDQAKKLKLKVEGWRDVILPLNSVLVWSQPYHPACIFGVVTTLFLTLWYLEPSLLTTLSLTGMVACLADYLVPLACSHLCGQDKWTGQHERQLQDICLEVVRAKQSVLGFGTAFKNMKQQNPKMHVTVVLLSLLVVAWIGSALDNLFLTYLVVLFLAMVPGMRRHGVFKKYFSAAVLFIRNLISDKMKKN